MPQERILVTGATGTLGRPLVARLVAGGHTVRTTSRRPRPAADGIEQVVADLTTGQGLTEALADVGTIVHCATQSERGADPRLTRTLVDAARQAGAAHLLCISIINIERVPFSYYRDKLASEQLIEESGLPFTILRTAQFHDFVATVLAQVAKLPVMPLPAGRAQPVDVGEVADRMAELAAGGPRGRVRDLAGPEVRDIADLTRSYLRAAGRRRPVWTLPLPGGTGRALREHQNIAPDADRGTISFDQWLGRQRPAGDVRRTAEEV